MNTGVNRKVNMVVYVTLAVVLIASLMIGYVWLQVAQGNTTSQQLANQFEVQSCRAATIGRLNVIRGDLDSAQTAVIRLGVAVVLKQDTKLTAEDAEEALDKAQEKYNGALVDYIQQVELSTKDPNAFVKECKNRGDI